MARLIETQSSPELPSPITLSPGDVLVLSGSGGHVRAGEGIVEFLGAFLPGTLHSNGSILAPMGSPDTVLVRALQPGQAVIEIVLGSPWHSTTSRTFEVKVEV